MNFFKVCKNLVFKTITSDLYDVGRLVLSPIVTQSAAQGLSGGGVGWGSYPFSSHFQLMVRLSWAVTTKSVLGD